MSKPFTIRNVATVEPVCHSCHRNGEACRCAVECENCRQDAWTNETEPVSPHNRTLGRICLDCIKAHCV